MSDIEEQMSIPEPKISLEEVVKAYLTIRNRKNSLAQEYQAKDRELKAELDQLEQVMLGSLNDVSADSIKTSGGTVIKTLKEYYVCSDWEHFSQYVIDNEELHLYQKRLNQTGMKEHLESRREDGLPPGVSMMREFQITVRKPTSK